MTFSGVILDETVSGSNGVNYRVNYTTIDDRPHYELKLVA